jgi:hypothetical protein
MDAEPWLGPGLVALRWWMILQAQVLWRAAVGPGWTAISVGLALVLSVSGATPWDVAPPRVDPWVAVAAEVGLGAVVGLVVGLPGYAVLGAARASARVLGTAPEPWLALTLSVVGATALGLGLHRPLLLGAHAVFEAWPVGDPLAWGTAVDVSVGRLAHGLALLALTLATPALLAGALGELVVRVVGARSGVGGGMADGLAPWLRVAGALVATGASWAAYDAVWAARGLGPLPG